ncbi:hypothetical protein OSTOST_25338 [Ostertagia ostertagi]
MVYSSVSVSPLGGDMPKMANERMLDTSDLPVLKPQKMDSDATIVAVGFNSTNLEKIVDQKGRAVKVPFAFTSEDVQNVVKAVLFQ